MGSRHRCEEIREPSLDRTVVFRTMFESRYLRFTCVFNLGVEDFRRSVGYLLSLAKCKRKSYYYGFSTIFIYGFARVVGRRRGILAASVSP